MASQDPFAPMPLFAFPFFSGIVSGFALRKDALVAEILALEEQFPGVVRSNRNAWHSDDELVRSTTPEMAWVREQVTAFSRRCLARFYRNWETSELELGHHWANVVEAGGFNGPHHHFPQVWSGTL